MNRLRSAALNWEELSRNPQEGLGRGRKVTIMRGGCCHLQALKAIDQIGSHAIETARSGRKHRAYRNRAGRIAPAICRVEEQTKPAAAQNHPKAPAAKSAPKSRAWYFPKNRKKLVFRCK